MSSLIILFITIILLPLAFFTTNPLQLLLHHPLLSLLSLLTLLISITLLQKRSGKHTTIFSAAGKSVTQSLIALCCATLLVCFIALMQMNLLSFISTTNPQLLGLQTNLSQITMQLKNNQHPPEIITTENVNASLLAISFATTGSNSFYANSILSRIPSILIIPPAKQNTLMLIDNTLIISNPTAKERQSISALLVYLFIKNYFSTRPIKSSPQVSLLTNQQYRTDRETDITQKLKKVDTIINKLEAQQASISAAIQTNQNNKEHNQTLIQQITTQKNEQYQSCLRAGTYISGKFQHTYTQTECQNLVGKWQETIAQGEKTNSEIDQEVVKQKTLFTQYQQYIDLFKSQKTIINNTRQTLPYEQALFEPENKIKIIEQDCLSHQNTCQDIQFLPFLQTLIHEYLHYTSYNDKTRFSTAFFEEALTEYFARQIFQSITIKSINCQHLNQLFINFINESCTLSPIAPDDIAYPFHVQIIQQMSKRIPESELADIYFTKDEEQLATTLNRVYGDNFYDQTHLLFESLQYSNNTHAQELTQTLLTHLR